MSHKEYASLEHISRSAIAWAPESYDGQTHFGLLMTAAVPALFILGLAASLLFVI